MPTIRAVFEMTIRGVSVRQHTTLGMQVLCSVVHNVHMLCTFPNSYGPNCMYNVIRWQLLCCQQITQRSL